MKEIVIYWIYYFICWQIIQKISNFALDKIGSIIPLVIDTNDPKISHIDSQII